MSEKKDDKIQLDPADPEQREIFGHVRDMAEGYALIDKSIKAYIRLQNEPPDEFFEMSRKFLPFQEKLKKFVERYFSVKDLPITLQ